MTVKAISLCSLGIALGLSACAGQPATLHSGADAQTVERGCVQSTGSRIRRDDGECLPVAGRAYGKSDIDRTGTRDLAGALTMMDPSISVGR